jgi:hypothetical protein
VFTGVDVVAKNTGGGRATGWPVGHSPPHPPLGLFLLIQVFCAYFGEIAIA